MRRLTLILTACMLAATVMRAQTPADSSILHFPAGRSSMENFLSKVKACRECPDSSATIWHIGGSHVQAGWFSSRLRHHFDSLSAGGAAGRGFIFPYPLAHTNYDHSFNISYEGEWTGSLSPNPNRKLPVQPRFGITGIAAYTAGSSACLCLGMPTTFTRLHILGESSCEDFTPLVISGPDTLACRADSLFLGYVTDFPAPVDSVQVRILLKEGEGFTLTGLLPEDDRGGIHYMSTGANGARTTTWMLRCPEFGREMESVKPDLMIFGLGINDSACPPADFRPERFKSNYRSLIDMILASSPGCAIIFITNNDSWRYARRRMVHNDNGEAVRRAMFELAEEYDGAVWDLFGIMGGNGSATAWRDKGLMKPDRLHFTREGYELLGDLLFDAIMQEAE